MSTEITPENDPAQAAQKPGYKTTEFWLTVAALVVGVLLGADVFPIDSPAVKILGMASSILGVLGYQVQRGLVKASGNKAAAIVAVSQGAPSGPPSAS